MNSKIFKNLIIFCCIFLVLASLTKSTIAQESILSRVQRIEDPELGELIRIALDNFNTPELADMKEIGPYADRYEKLKAIVDNQKITTVRKITEAYSEIKMLGNQLEQVDKRISSQNTPETLTNELLLAKAELQAKLNNKLAELREIMYIIPIHPLGRRPIKQLNTWIKLDVTGEQVVVFNCSKPFNEFFYDMKHNFVKLMSPKEAFDYVTGNIQTLPIRIDISRNPDGIKLSEELNKQIIAFIKEKNLEMQAEVHMDDEIIKAFSSSLYIYNKEIGRTDRLKSINNGQGSINIRLQFTIDPNEIESIIRDRLIEVPGQLPHIITLNHDEQSKDFALSIEKTIKDIAQKAGIEKLVTVKMELYDF